jgi:AhpD family alkylhydroperoxidase
MNSLDSYLVASGLDNILLHLVRLRSSQINGCAYCIDMHWKDLRALGEPECRLYSLDAWRESPYYSDKERAALSWAEAVTLINETRVPEEVYRDVWPQLSEKELCDLTLAIAAINAWNRLSIAARLKPGSYKSPFSEVH